MSSVAIDPRSRRHVNHADGAGVGLSLALGGWLVAGAIARNSPWTPVGVYVAPVLAFLVGRLAVRFSVRGALLGLVVASTLPLVWGLPDIARDRPLGRPFSYVNATAAFAVQAEAVALTLAYTARTRWGKAAAAAMAAVFGAIPFVVGSLAGSILAAVVAAAGPTGRVIGTRRSFRWIVVSTFVLVLAGTVVMGAAYDEAGDRSLLAPAASLLSERRLSLWAEAVDHVWAEPVFGIGLGRFDASSPTVRADPDTPTAHNAFLQMAAEAGLLAGALLAGMFVWAIVVATRADVRVGASAAATTAVAVAALALHACVDHVLDVAAIPLLTATLLGIVTGKTALHPS